MVKVASLFPTEREEERMEFQNREERKQQKQTAAGVSDTAA